MNDRLKFAAFGGGLVVLFGAALGIGALVGDPAEPAPGHGTGLQATQEGYTLSEVSAPTEPRTPGTLRFRITGPDGAPVTQYTDLHEQDLHLIAVRSDTTEYRHVHPVRDDTGTWSIDWTWAQPGTYRIFADSRPTAAPDELVLSRTVTVTGATADRPLPPVSRTTTVDGYQVRMDGDLSTAGGEVGFTVTRDGRPVTDLQPYLGAYGHLVALRGNDLSYLHVHPEGEVGSTPAGPRVAFHAQAPSTGAFRLYLDFAHGGAVHTAEFTAEAVTGQQSGHHDNEHNNGEHGGGHQ
ncbi:MULTISPECIES: hypothetical protein [Nocardia]|jgi:hypothetical protein|uniref:hypothetical protein n=1 Tax=Nocardia TaxID=1817 RepID=UPI0007A382E6|nr:MULTISPECIES: hypothetical protein [Nocardia]MBV7706775.1 hypothetical protein [Nocardia nova]OBA49286.1 hypothetical protein A5789_32220 [Nocardia sp. 852002-51101_SCH5132738]OBB53848.1 hypothetical protein A5748_13495 [Nocardia sp. 852002-51244_SCH5132740]OBF70237.1 hypothetical protein A9X06_31200 [Mycobacterium sp. 852002-51759_SCH5129042]